jgi:FMN reductase
MRILGMCGSLRSESVTLKAMRIAAEGIEQAGGTCDLLFGEDMDLPLYSGDGERGNHPGVVRLLDLAEKADGFLIGSPEYHGSCSGISKNALDWLEIDHFDGKPSALLAVAGGGSAFNTLNHLRIIVRWVHGWVLPDQVSIGGAGKAFDSKGRPVDPKDEKRLIALGKNLVKAAKILPQLSE